MRSARSAMRMVRVSCIILLASACAGWTPAQEPGPGTEQSPASVPVLTRRTSASPSPASSAAQLGTIPLTVPKGTPIQVVLAREVRVKKVGQPVQGRVAEPVYAFDQLVIPVGAQVMGHIMKIDHVSHLERTLAALDADFTPARRVDLEFSELILPNGKHISIQTRVTPGSGQVIQFVTSSDDKTKQGGVKAVAAEKTKQAKLKAKREWDDAMAQVKTSGRMHRIKRYAVARFPVHPQHIDAGAVYFAELEDPLDFGSEPMTPQTTSMIGTSPPPGSFLRARLLTPLNSSISKTGDEVEAVLSQPLLDGEHLLLPQGSRLIGTVQQAKPARRMHRDGQLRIAFRELIPPDGIQQKLDASLEGIQAGKNDNVKLDMEGGAKATSSKSRYLTTAISVGFAAISQGGDREPVGGVTNQAGNASSRIAGGAVGFKLIGIVLGATIHSRGFGASMGAYGAGMSVYKNFIARGRDVSFPKDTAMIISTGTRNKPAVSPREGEPPASLPKNLEPNEGQLVIPIENVCWRVRVGFFNNVEGAPDAVECPDLVQERFGQN